MTTLAPVAVGGVTKGALVETAFENCGLVAFEFGRTADEMAMGLRRLQMMMRAVPWSRTTFNYADYGFGQADEASGLDDEDVGAVVAGLTISIATAMGKMVPPEFGASAKPLIAAFRAKYANIPTQEFAPGTIRGAGSKQYDRRGPWFFETVPVREIVYVTAPVVTVTPTPSPTPSPPPPPPPVVSGIASTLIAMGMM